MKGKTQLQNYAVTDIDEIQISPDGYTDREAEKAVLKYGMKICVILHHSKKFKIPIDIPLSWMYNREHNFNRKEGELHVYINNK